LEVAGQAVLQELLTTHLGQTASRGTALALEAGFKPEAGVAGLAGQAGLAGLVETVETMSLFILLGRHNIQIPEGQAQMEQAALDLEDRLGLEAVVAVVAMP
jgi:hypothetical protein